MTHTNYFKINADSNQDLGFQEGQLFGELLRRVIKQDQREIDQWKKFPIAKSLKTRRIF
jgi:hypothetical protein